MSAGEARPRERRIVNAEHLTAVTRRIVNAWLRPELDKRRDGELRDAVDDARKLLGMDGRDPEVLK